MGARQQLIVTDMDNRPGHVFADGLRVLLAAAGRAGRGPPPSAHGYDTWALRPLDAAPPRPAVPGGWDCDANALVRDANFRPWSRVCAQTAASRARPVRQRAARRGAAAARARRGGERVQRHRRRPRRRRQLHVRGERRLRARVTPFCMRAHGGRLAVYPRVRRRAARRQGEAEDGARARAMAMNMGDAAAARMRTAGAAAGPSRREGGERLVSALNGAGAGPEDDLCALTCSVFWRSDRTGVCARP